MHAFLADTSEHSSSRMGGVPVNLILLDWNTSVVEHIRDRRYMANYSLIFVSARAPPVQINSGVVEDIDVQVATAGATHRATVQLPRNLDVFPAVNALARTVAHTALGTPANSSCCLTTLTSVLQWEQGAQSVWSVLQWEQGAQSVGVCCNGSRTDCERRCLHSDTWYTDDGMEITACTRPIKCEASIPVCGEEAMFAFSVDVEIDSEDNTAGSSDMERESSDGGGFVIPRPKRAPKRASSLPGSLESSVTPKKPRSLSNGRKEEEAIKIRRTPRQRTSSRKRTSASARSPSRTLMVSLRSTRGSPLSSTTSS